MRIKSVSHAGLTVSDFETALAWYHERFGFLLVSEDRLGSEATAALFPLYGVKDATVRMGFMRAPGGAVVELFQFEPASRTAGAVWNAPGLTHLALDVGGVAAWTERLKAEGVVFVTEPQRTAGVDWVFLRDPDGNLVELIDLGPKRPALRFVGGLLGSLKKRGGWASYYARR